MSPELIDLESRIEAAKTRSKQPIAHKMLSARDLPAVYILWFFASMPHLISTFKH